MNCDLIELLERFNRKERFFLVGQALGNRKFRLSEDFRDQLQSAIGLSKRIPADSFVAMDYHLDWIAAVLAAFASGDGNQVFINRENNDKKLVMGNQEDVDLLVCFKFGNNDYKLIFLEAKGYTSWTSKQMSSKLRRLKLIFGENGALVEGVEPTYCLVSPERPKKLDCGGWPDWALGKDGEPHWLKLTLPGDRLRVTRWCKDKCRPSRSGRHFRIQDS